MADRRTGADLLRHPGELRAHIGESAEPQSATSRISSTGYQPSTGNFDVPGFYFVGSTHDPEPGQLSGNYRTVNELVIYGPDTDINVSGNATFKGIVAVSGSR